MGADAQKDASVWLPRSGGIYRLDIVPGAAFGRDKRLLTARDYTAVFKNPPYRVSDQYMLLLARPNGRGYSRLGCVVAKKNVRRAVARNRIKRVVRDTFRRQQFLMPMDIVFIAHKGLDLLVPQAQTQCLQKNWQRLAHRADRSGEQK